MRSCASVACAVKGDRRSFASIFKTTFLGSLLGILVADCVVAQSAPLVGQTAKPAAELFPAELIPLPPVQYDAPLALANAEQLALERNPSLGRAAAVVRAARGQWLQSGLMPDPILNVGEAQIASLGREEQDFAGVTQTIVSARKRTLSRAAAAAEVSSAEQDFISQRNRVLTDVRIAFYDLLIANEQLATTQRSLQISRDAVATAKKVAKDETGQNDILEADIEQYNAEISLRFAQNRAIAAKTNLGAIVGNPQARFDNLAGQPDALPAPRDWQQSLNQLLNRSSELAAGAADAEQSRWALERAQAQRIPDVSVQGLVNWRDNGIGGRSDGALQFSVPLPVWNRNRGARVFAVAVGLGLAGAAAFSAAMSNSLTRGNNLSNQLGGLGVGLLGIAGISTLIATFLGTSVAIKNKRIPLWLIPSILATAGAPYGGMRSNSSCSTTHPGRRWRPLSFATSLRTWQET